ncbi:hypothetical protein BGZ76_008859 [Entomortierella beljakovae]|nr:hypothetical protein BGZ76_008859 [Entomortierella beljakovae]
MFRLVNRRLAVNRELVSLRQEFNQCSLPIDFVYRIVVSCVDEIMKRGLNHPFILKNPYPPTVASAMLTLMADPDRRDLYSIQCMRIDTVAGVMLAALKNLREAIVPMEIQEELTSVKPDMLASILGPHIFASQHATILQHTPQQAYSFGWGVALVNDIKRCSKMFYVLLGGYKREILGAEEWDYDPSMSNVPPLGITISGAPLSASSLSQGNVNQWLGSTATIHGGLEADEEKSQYFDSNNQQRLHQSVPQLRVIADGENTPRHSLSRYDMVRKVSTTFTESIRAAAAQEAKHWDVDKSNSGTKGPAALEHLRDQDDDSSPGFSHSGNGNWFKGGQRNGSTIEQRQRELFQRKFKDSSDEMNELNSVYLRRKIQNNAVEDEDEDDMEFRQREQKRMAFEQMIRECRGAGSANDSDPMSARREGGAMAFS